MSAPQGNSVSDVGTGHTLFSEVPGEDANKFSVAPKFGHN